VRLTVLYGSQTGTAHEIAKGISAEASSKGIKSQVGDAPMTDDARALSAPSLHVTRLLHRAQP
jgi:sulfite reductase alpha subunit-like flavoprotein